MLLNAQLALAAQHNPLLASAYAQLNSNPLMSSAAAERLRSHRFSPYPYPPSPGLPGGPPTVSSAGSVSPAGSPTLGLTTTANSGSAFHSIIPRQKSSQHSAVSLLSSSSKSPVAGESSSPPPTSQASVASTKVPSRSPSPKQDAEVKSADSRRSVSPKSGAGSPPISTGKGPNASDIKSMENLVNGLNGSNSSKFGISHDQREISTT